MQRKKGKKNHLRLFLHWKPILLGVILLGALIAITPKDYLPGSIFFTQSGSLNNISDSTLSHPTLAEKDTDELYIAYVDNGSSNQITIKKISLDADGVPTEPGSNSATFGSNTSDEPNLFITGSTAYVAYADNDTDLKLIPINIDGATPIAGTASASLGSQPSQISAMMYGNMAFIAFADGSNSNKLSLVKTALNTNPPTIVGSVLQNLSTSGVNNLTGITNDESYAYITFRDDSGIQVAKVLMDTMVKDNNSPLSIESGVTGADEDAVISGGNLYVAYQDPSNSNLLSVAKVALATFTESATLQNVSTNAIDLVQIETDGTYLYTYAHDDTAGTQVSNRILISTFTALNDSDYDPSALETNSSLATLLHSNNNIYIAYSGDQEGDGIVGYRLQMDYVSVGPSLAISSISPTDYDTDVALTSNIDVTFDEAVDSSTFTSASFRVWSKYKGLLPGTYSVPSSTIGRFDPTSNFLPGDTIIIAASSEDITGTNPAYELTNSYYRKFHTAVSSSSTGLFATASSNVTTSQGTGPERLVAADFNQDGNMDLAITLKSSNKVALVQGEGTTTLPAQGSSFTVGSGPTHIETGDFNSDGYPDLVVSNNNAGTGDTVSILLNKGASATGWSDQFYTHTEVTVDATCNGASGLDIFDFDPANNEQDYDLDIGVACENGPSWILNNTNGAGNFTPTRMWEANSDLEYYLVNESSPRSWSIIQVVPALGKSDTDNGDLLNGTSANSLATGLFNNDAYLDIAITQTGDDTVRIYLYDAVNNRYGTNASGTPNQTITVQDAPKGIRAALLNNDAYPDLIVANSGTDESISIILNDGDGTGTFDTTPTNISVGEGTVDVEVADFNNDGIMDLVSTASSEDEYYYTFGATIPGQPTGVSGTVDGSNIDLTWTAPDFTGGFAITDYTIEYSSNSGIDWNVFLDEISAVTSATVTGLSTSATYIFRVSAVNAAGTGSASSNSASVTFNTAPTANAGPDQTSAVYTGQTVALDGSGSSDVDQGAVITYAWTFSLVPDDSDLTQLTNPTSTTPSFTPDIAGEYIVQLIVNDGTVDSTADTVIITVTATGGGTRRTVIDTGISNTPIISSGGGGSGGSSGIATTTTLAPLTTTTEPAPTQESLIAHSLPETPQQPQFTPTIDFFDFRNMITRQQEETAKDTTQKGDQTETSQAKKETFFKINKPISLGTLSDLLTRTVTPQPEEVGAPPQQLPKTLDDALNELSKTVEKSLQDLDRALEERKGTLSKAFEKSLGDYQSKKVAETMTVREQLLTTEKTKEPNKKTVADAITVTQENISITGGGETEQDQISLNIRSGTLIENLNAQTENEAITIAQPIKLNSSSDLSNAPTTSQVSQILIQASRRNMELTAIEIPHLQTDSSLPREDVPTSIVAEGSGGPTGHKLSQPATLTFSVEKLLKNPIVLAFDSGTGRPKGILPVTFSGLQATITTDTFTVFVMMSVEDAIGLGYLAPVPTFTDLTGDYAWSAKFVGDLAEKYVIKGKGTNRFAPGDNITRAELTKIALLTFGFTVDETKTTNGFTDMPQTHWANAAVRRGRETAIIGGYADGTFQPDQPVTRAEAMKILITAAQIDVSALANQKPFTSSFATEDEEEKPSPTINLTLFPDVNGKEWYAPYINYSVKNGIASGYPDGTFGPSNPITRAAVTKVAVNLRNHLLEVGSEQQISYLEQTKEQPQEIAMQTPSMQEGKEISGLRKLWLVMQDAMASIFQWMEASLLGLFSLDAKP